MRVAVLWRLRDGDVAKQCVSVSELDGMEQIDARYNRAPDIGQVDIDFIVVLKLLLLVAFCPGVSAHVRRNRSGRQAAHQFDHA